MGEDGDWNGGLQYAVGGVEYIQHVGSHHHTTTVPDMVVADSDAVVLESGATRHSAVTPESLHGRTQYKRLVEQCVAHKTSIYLVDVPYRRSAVTPFVEAGLGLGVPFLAGLYGMVHQHAGFGALTVPALAFCMGSNTVGGRVVPYLQLTGAYTSFGYRSALTAKKTETVVVPRIGADDPTVLIDYGAAHRDIKPYLQYPRLRQAVIAVNRRTNTAVDETQADSVCAFRFGDGDQTADIAGETVWYSKEQYWCER